MSYKVIHGKLVRTKGAKAVKPAPFDWRKDRLDYEAQAAETAKNVAKAERKGQYLGACNRSACLAPGAAWYNRGSYAFYCAACARMLNHANRHDEFCKEAQLCRLVTAEEAATLHVLS